MRHDSQSAEIFNLDDARMRRASAGNREQGTTGPDLLNGGEGAQIIPFPGTEVKKAIGPGFSAPTKQPEAPASYVYDEYDQKAGEWIAELQEDHGKNLRIVEVYVRRILDSGQTGQTPSAGYSLTLEITEEQTLFRFATPGSALETTFQVLNEPGSGGLRYSDRQLIALTEQGESAPVKIVYADRLVGCLREMYGELPEDMVLPNE